jgi:hypothetical protein
MEELNNLILWIKGEILRESIEYLVIKNNKKVSILFIGDSNPTLGDLRRYVKALRIINSSKVEEGVNRMPTNMTDFENEIDKYKYDIVMCDMTLHQLFKEGHLLDNFMSLVHDQLNDEGFFIGVAIDGDKVNRLFMHRDEIFRGMYRLKSHFELNESITPYGNMFDLEIQGDTIKKIYAVTLMELKEVAEKNKLLFVAAVDFTTWFQKYQEKKYEKLSKQEKEIAFLHFTYFFKKAALTSNPPAPNIDNH